MEKRPGIKTIDDWAKRDPDADIVYIPGLCSTGKGRRGIIVVDPDDADTIGQANKLFGDTPGRVRTRRGQHMLFDGSANGGRS